MSIFLFFSSQVNDKIVEATKSLDGKHFVAGLNTESGEKILLKSEDFQTLYDKPSRNLIEFYISQMKLLLVGRTGEFLIKLVDVNESSTSSQSSEFMIIVS